MRSAYKTDKLGKLKWILGMRVTRDRAKRTITLDQSLYIKDMLKRFDMDKPGMDPPLAIPADPNAKLSRAQCPTNPVDQARMKNLKYSSIVGSILFACVCTRPDIANATRDVCRYMHNPGMPHYRAARRILRYLKVPKTWESPLVGVPIPLNDLPIQTHHMRHVSTQGVV